MRLHYFLIFPLILITTVWMARMNSTEESDYWVYNFHEGETAYEITRTDARTNTSELITTIPFVADFTLASIMPGEELLVAESFVASHSILRDEEPSAEETYAFFNRLARPRLVKIVPSPDNQTIAMAIRYMECTSYPAMTCFGLNQIVLYSLATTGQHVLWSTPIQAKTSFFPSSEDSNYIHIDGMADVSISSFRWTSNQESIVVQLAYDSYSNVDAPLALIPIAYPENAILIGNGAGSWTVSPDSQAIIMNHRDFGSEESLVSVIHFSREFEPISRSYYPVPIFGNVIGRIYPTKSGMVYFQNRIIFGIILETSIAGGTYFYQLVAFHPESGEISLIESQIERSYRNIQASSSLERLIVEDSEGYLWQLIPAGNSFALEAVTSVPVTYWQFANDDELILQFSGDDFYSIVDISR